jgi:peptide chain release factor 1
MQRKKKKMKITIEIRAGEGGEDAKLLIENQAAIYLAYCKKNNLVVDIEDSENSWLIIYIHGKTKDVSPLLKEAGGHRWQRVPPTEKRGRVHTSTVTVAVLELPYLSYTLKDDDIEIFTTKDSGPGGQHRNKTESCVVMRHIPTGIEAKASTKSQHRNKVLAREVLEARVSALFKTQNKIRIDNERKCQVGSGMRGDKIRTYRQRDNIVNDHKSGRKTSLSSIQEGRLELLW